MRDRDRRSLAYIRTCLHQASVSTLRLLWWYCSHWKEWSHSKIGCNPILEQLHCFQSEQYRRVVGALILSLGVKGPLNCTLQYWLKETLVLCPVFNKNSIFAHVLLLLLFSPVPVENTYQLHLVYFRCTSSIFAFNLMQSTWKGRVLDIDLRTCGMDVS